ncbi:hypothetical protein FH972_005200 [Carpinus fangiana]|uniref:Amidase domain-containing protein n=1 Tax=Carpinus fangiana TaxID=176857 RepID=A0A5N6QNI5_9ROSI|nr:hypothetical protein FH972_005200 [Carpinus fangiana]
MATNGNSPLAFSLFPMFPSLLLLLLAILSYGSHIITGDGFSITEATIGDLQLAFKRNQLTSRQLVKFYIGEIRRLHPVLNGVIEVNPNALYQADKVDHERRAKAPGSLSGLHGIPILLKDNVGIRDKLNTTASSLTLLSSVVPRDAGLVTKPVSKTVSDAVYVLDAIVGFDYNDGATWDAVNYIPHSGYKQFLNAYRQGGAVLIDNLEIANIDVFLNAALSGETTALLAEFKLSLNAYLKELVASPVRTLADVIAFNDKFSDLINALVTPGANAAPVLAIGGFPAINVPTGYDSKGVPFGISFGGLKGSEPKLIEISYGFEEATKIRKPPSFKP